MDGPAADLGDSPTASSSSTYPHNRDGGRVSTPAPPTEANTAFLSGSADPDGPPDVSSNSKHPNGPDSDRFPAPTPPGVVVNQSRSGTANVDEPPTAFSSPPPQSNGPDVPSRKVGAFGTGSRSGATVAGAVMGGLVAGGAGVVAGGAGAVVGGIALRAASGREDGIGRVAKKMGSVADVAMDKVQ